MDKQEIKIQNLIEMINAAIVLVQAKNVDHIINNSPTLSTDGSRFLWFLSGNL